MNGMVKILALLFLLAASLLSFLGLHYEQEIGWQILAYSYLTFGLKLLSVVILSLHVIQNPELDAFYKSNYVFGALTLELIVIPMYWYKYIWRGSLNPHKLSISSGGQQVEVN